MFIVYGPLLAQTVIKHHLITLFQHLSSLGVHRGIRHLLFALIPPSLKDTLLTATMLSHAPHRAYSPSQTKSMHLIAGKADSVCLPKQHRNTIFHSAYKRLRLFLVYYL